MATMQCDGFPSKAFRVLHSFKSDGRSSVNNDKWRGELWFVTRTPDQSQHARLSGSTTVVRRRNRTSGSLGWKGSDIFRWSALCLKHTDALLGQFWKTKLKNLYDSSSFAAETLLFKGCSYTRHGCVSRLCTVEARSTGKWFYFGAYLVHLQIYCFAFFESSASVLFTQLYRLDSGRRVNIWLSKTLTTCFLLPLYCVCQEAKQEAVVWWWMTCCSCVRLNEY